MTTEQILIEWKKKKFKPIYWLEGDEPFFINEVVDYAEQHLLGESEKSFNQTVFYGRDADWAAIINACRRYPMFSERQVVILKEAQQMKDILKLEAYLQQPLDSTIFVVAYKDKKVDGRSKLARLLKDSGGLVTTKKLYESQLPEWVSEQLALMGYTMTQKAIRLLIDHTGNDLSRIRSEIDKMAINLGQRKSITEEDVENFVGISREFNAFELQEALTRKDMAKALRIVQYFQSNPKAGPIQLVLPALYNFFSKVYMIFGLPAGEEKNNASLLGTSSYFIKDYMQAARTFGFGGTEEVLLLLHQYNLKSLSIGSAGTSDASLMKELIVKMM